MMWILLTNEQGKKVRVAVGRIVAYWATMEGITQLELAGMEAPLYVTESPEDIDELREKAAIAGATSRLGICQEEDVAENVALLMGSG